MKWIRCLSLFFVLLMCLASTDAGAETINNRKFAIQNKNELDAYCAYAYLVDEEDVRNTENLPGLHVKGWIYVPSGRAVNIEYASNFSELYYCIILADGRKLEGIEKKTYAFSVPKDLMEDSFKVVHELNGGIIGAVRYTSVDEADLETQGFSREDYGASVLGIPGPVEIKREDAAEIAEDGTIRQQEPQEQFLGQDVSVELQQEELQGQLELQHELQEQLANAKAMRDDLMEKIKHLDQRIKEIENLLNALQKHPDPKFDGVYDTQGFVRQGKDYALLLATDRYQHWDDLNTSIRDAEAIGNELEKYGFQVEIKKNLKTRADILNTLSAYAKKDYQPGDQLFVYFTGHGNFDAKIRLGYIAASDSKLPADDPIHASYLSYAELKQVLDRLACPRILLVLDVSYGGTFDDKIALGKGTTGNDNPSTKDDVTAKGPQPQLHLAETLKVKTRWYLSAGGKEDVQDGMEHSLFTLSLLTVLRDGAGKDGVLTVPEIEHQLPSKLQAELDKLKGLFPNAEIQQTPASGPFGSGKKSDNAFVFIKAQK